MRTSTSASAVGLAFCLPLFLSASIQRQEPPREELRQPAQRASMELMERAEKIESNLPPTTLESFYPAISDAGLLSPDGKWRLREARNERTARATDGSLVVRRRAKTRFWAPASDNILWLRDSRRWARLMAGQKGLFAVIEGVGPDGASREVPIGNPKCTISWPDLMPSTLLGLVGNGSRMLAKASRDYYERDTRMPFYSFDISGGPPRVREFSIAWPKGARDWDEVALSPRGDRLAWLFYFGRSRRPDDGQIQEVRLALSQADGSQMRTVARLRVGGSVKANRELVNYSHLPRQIAWLSPSEVSFAYQNARWKITVG